MLIPSVGQIWSVLGLLHSQGLQKPLSSGKFLDTTNEIPGGTPFRFCPESRDTDLFQISSAVIDKQPIYIDDAFMVHLEGEFLDTWTSNATFDMTLNCGSFCDLYNVTDPRSKEGETGTMDFCSFNQIEQPLGYDRKQYCPPVKGPAMTTTPGYAFPMFVWWPMYYNFTFDVKAMDGRRIYCLTAEVCLRWEDDEKNDRYSHDRPWGHCKWPREPYEIS